MDISMIIVIALVIFAALGFSALIAWVIIKIRLRKLNKNIDGRVTKEEILRKMIEIRDEQSKSANEREVINNERRKRILAAKDEPRNSASRGKPEAKADSSPVQPIGRVEEHTDLQTTDILSDSSDTKGFDRDKRTVKENWEDFS
jgi:biopolymer transport protein ExbB/TolQ